MFYKSSFYKIKFLNKLCCLLKLFMHCFDRLKLFSKIPSCIEKDMQNYLSRTLNSLIKLEIILRTLRSAKYNFVILRLINSLLFLERKFSGGPCLLKLHKMFSMLCLFSRNRIVKQQFRFKNVITRRLINFIRRWVRSVEATRKEFLLPVRLLEVD